MGLLEERFPWAFPVLAFLLLANALLWALEAIRGRLPQVGNTARSWRPRIESSPCWEKRLGGENLDRAS